MASRAAKGPTQASGRASALQVAVEEPKNGPIREHQQDVESEPQTYRGVGYSVNQKPWGQAMEHEYENLDAIGTFIPAELPKGRKAAWAKWIFQWKINQHGEVTKAKARLMALDNLQREVIDYVDAFYPTPAALSIRVIFTLALNLDLKLTHLDVQLAFTQSTLSEETYKRLSQGCGEMCTQRRSSSLLRTEELFRFFNARIRTRSYPNTLVFSRQEEYRFTGGLLQSNNAQNRTKARYLFLLLPPSHASTPGVVLLPVFIDRHIRTAPRRFSCAWMTTVGR